MRIALELLYVALENVTIVAAEDRGAGGLRLAWLLALAVDMQRTITEYW